MNQSDKKVFWVVGGIFIAVIALTVYLEIKHQETYQQEFSAVPNNAGISSEQTGPVNVIPAGLHPDNLPDADSRGATMLTLYCAQCHELPPPAMHSRVEWDAVLDRMQNHMHSTSGSMLRHVLMPPKKDWQILKVYLEDHSQIPLDKTSTKDLDTGAGQVFKTYCSQCHAPPNPATHTKNEWPRVVLRMKSHIMRIGKKMPDQKILMQIIEYLQKHAKSSNGNEKES